MERSLLLSLELMPTAMVGLGKRGSAIVDRFFELLPPSLRHMNLLQGVTPALMHRIIDADRPKSGEALLLYAIDRAVRISKNAVSEGGLVPVENHRFSNNPSLYRALVAVSPFEELSTQLLTICSQLEEAAARMGCSEIAIDILLLGEFSPGPAAQRRSQHSLDDLSAHIKKQHIQAEITQWCPRYSLFWLDHTNEKGETLKKDVETYDSNASRIIELLLSPARGMLLKPEIMPASKTEEDDNWLLTASSIGMNALEVPVGPIAAMGIARQLAQIYYQAADLQIVDVSQDLISKIEEHAELTSEHVESTLIPNEAANSAERIAKRLSRLPSTHFLLGGEPTPELTTLRAGLERLLNEAGRQIDTGAAAKQLAKQRGALIKAIVEAHIDESTSGLAESETTIRHMLATWPERIKGVRSDIERLDRTVEQRGRKIAWLTDENEKRSGRLSWRKPLLSVVLKSLLIAIPLSAIAAFAALTLPGLAGVPVSIIGATAGGSFVTSLTMFMFKYFQDRSVIPELLHELGNNALMRIELIGLREHYQFLERLEAELADSLSIFKKYRDLLRTTSSDLAQQAFKELHSLSTLDSPLCQINPRDDEIISEFIEKHMGSEKFMPRLLEMTKHIPRTQGDVAEYTDRAMAWGISEAIPALLADEQLQPGNRMAELVPQTNGRGDLIAAARANCPTWFKGFQAPGSVEPVPEIFTLNYDGGTSIIERRTLFAFTPNESRELRKAASASGSLIYDGVVTHAICIYSAISGIPLGMISSPNKVEASAAR